MTDSELQREIERCQREIAEIERQLRAGHTDLQGLLLGLHDWSMELRILTDERRQEQRQRTA